MSPDSKVDCGRCITLVIVIFVVQLRCFSGSFPNFFRFSSPNVDTITFLGFLY